MMFQDHRRHSVSFFRVKMAGSGTIEGFFWKFFFYLVRNLIELAKKFTDSYGNVTTIRYKKTE
jgi:hypothetical protein